MYVPPTWKYFQFPKTHPRLACAITHHKLVIVFFDSDVKEKKRKEQEDKKKKEKTAARTFIANNTLSILSM
jgi:hypothetical protein